jgi:hypothetical protein
LARQQTQVNWFIWFMKLIVSFTGAGIIVPLHTRDQYFSVFKEMDFYYKCAIGQDNFTQENFKTGWMKYKTYINHIAEDMSQNGTPIYYFNSLKLFRQIWTEIAEGKISPEIDA